ncbi:MAG: insulinase family protein [Candidatus Cloacimonetes bacterium]|nr:insulinase family protein [Candidatus Cloacimonadota bacterium]
MQEDKIVANISSKTLNNGFKTIMAPHHAHPVISLQLFVRIGSCWESEQEAGYSHLMEHLVFKSTKKFPANALTVRASYLGSNINAYTEFDSTCYYLTLSSQFSNDGLEILSELVRQANFSTKEFSYEKGVVLEELNQYQNDPEDHFLEEIPKLYFIESPFKKPIIGDRDSLTKATRAKLNQFYKKYYIPQNCYLVVSGDFNKQELLEQVEFYFGDWQPGDLAIQHEKVTTYPESFIIKSLPKNVAKSMLGFVLPELSDKNPESHTLGLITRIFAIGKKSRLYRRLFVKEKLVDQIRVESFTGINDGISVILIIPKSNADIEQIIEIFLEEFELIRHFGFSIDEFNEAKTELLHSHRYSFEYMRYLGMSLGTEEMLGDYKLFIEYPKMLKKISERSVYDILKKYYNFQQLGIFHLGKNFSIEDKIKARVKELQVKKIKNGAIKSDFYETSLPSGTKVLFKRVVGRPTIGITAAFRVSQLNEITENRGINLLTSIMLLYGNQRNSYDQLLEFCSQHGIQIDITAQEEVTLVKVKCFTEMFATSLELLADIIKYPLFPAEHFHNIQKTLLSNLERVKDFPVYYAAYLWKRQFFGRDSNLLEREGTKTTLRKLTRKQILNWFYEHYNSSQMILSIVGDFDFEDTLFNCERIFRGEKSKTIISKQKVIFSPNKLHKRNTLPQNQQAIIHIGGLGCSAQEIEKNTAFHLLAQVIGGDMNSRLTNELREKRGWAYTTGFDYLSTQEIGFFVASAMVDKKKSKQAYALMIKILEDIKKKGVTEEELEIAKNTVRGQRLRAEESVLGQASALAMLDLLGYGYEYYLKREERLQKVTTKDLQNIAREYFKVKNLYCHFLE